MYRSIVAQKEETNDKEEQKTMTQNGTCNLRW